MSKPKRRSMADQLGQEEAVTSSRDHVIKPQEPVVAAEAEAVPATELVKTPAPEAVKRAAPKPAKELRRNTYHASLYLPDEARFALREIALTMRRAKPHDVMLEAMAELFEKYNKGDLAKECRSRITSRDSVIT